MTEAVRRVPGQPWSIDDLFENRPKLRALFETVRADVATLGPVELVVTRTQVSFVALRRFAWLAPSPMPTRGEHPEGTLTLTLEMTEPRQHRLISSVQETFPGKWTHQVTLTDDPVLQEIRRQGWIAAAYEFGTMQRARTRRN